MSKIVDVIIDFIGKCIITTFLWWKMLKFKITGRF